MGKVYTYKEISAIAGEPLNDEESKAKLLEMMTAFDSFCEAQKLRYWLVGGTLLGAVRNKGFIPWDDDADVIMPRTDYNRLMEHTKINDEIDVVSVLHDCGYYHPFTFTKLSDHSTVSIISDSNRNTGRGQFLDIFPLDNVPDNINEKKRFLKRLKRLQKMRILAIRKYGHGFNLKSHAVNVVTFLSRPLSRVWLMKKIDATAQKWNHMETKKWGMISFNTVEMLQFDKADFKETIRIPFEGRLFPVPAGYDNVLRHHFGNYMQLPPLEQRVGKHDVTIYWKKRQDK